MKPEGEGVTTKNCGSHIESQGLQNRNYRFRNEDCIEDE